MEWGDQKQQNEVSIHIDGVEFLIDKATLAKFKPIEIILIDGTGIMAKSPHLKTKKPNCGGCSKN